jgi:hypothetical protein
VDLRHLRLLSLIVAWIPGFRIQSPKDPEDALNYSVIRYRVSTVKSVTRPPVLNLGFLLNFSIHSPKDPEHAIAVPSLGRGKPLGNRKRIRFGLIWVGLGAKRERQARVRLGFQHFVFHLFELWGA